MSIHGIQKFLPFTVDVNNKVLDAPVDYTVGFKNCIDQKREGEKLKIFSRLAWPLILIHGSISSHILIDDVGICSLNTKITNAPRQSIVGHILRNMDGRTYNEMLNHIINIITYTESGKQFSATDVKEEEREEFKDIIIKGFLNPEIIDGIGVIIKKLKEDPISDYSLLESAYSVELGLDLAQKYKDYMGLIKANKGRWEALIELIKDPFNEWINDLHVQIKDTELRYKTTIIKEESNITEGEVKKLIKTEGDSTDQWIVQEKKAILEKIGGSFLPINQLLEALVESNKKFLNTDSFKTIQLEKAVMMAKKQTEIFDEFIGKFKDKVDSIKLSIKEFLETMKSIDSSAKDRINQKELKLKTQLAQRNTRIQTISSASESYIRDLKNAENGLISKLEEINKIIEKKIDECDKNIQIFNDYGLPDKVSGISQTVIRIFMPVYAALFVNSEDEERFVFAFPSIVEKGLKCKELSEGVKKWQQTTTKIVEDDMKIRSNFEFTVEKQNLIHDNKIKKFVTDGLTVLKTLNLVSSDQEESINKELNEISP